jgi:multidrug resistance efflux pump
VDIPREQKKSFRRYLLPGGGLIVAGLVTWGVLNLQPAAPTELRSALMFGEVKRGEMLRQIRGNGSLVPEHIRWVSSIVSGRVENILAERGQHVTANTVLMELANPDEQLRTLGTEQQLAAAEADSVRLLNSLETQRLNLQASIASAKLANAEAARQLKFNEDLAKQGMATPAELQRSREQAEEATTRYETQLKLMTLFESSIEPQLSTQRRQLAQVRASAEFQRTRAASMRVTAGADGVLQELPLEMGQWANAGATIAKVVQPDRLKAVLRVQENQAKDLAIGQHADIDTRNGIIPGHVSRIDAAAQGGTVTVDVALDGPLPAGARVDLSVDGVIEIERLEDVLYVARPVVGNSESNAQVFKLEPGRGEATRVVVRFGKNSVTSIEIVSGLAAGDSIILSPMDRFDGKDRVIIR